MFLQASIRAPVGATFVPRTAHLKLIKPRIKTRAGEVIEPMSRYLIQKMIHMNINFYIWKNTNPIINREQLVRRGIVKEDLKIVK